MFVYFDRCVSITQITPRAQKGIKKNMIDTLTRSDIVQIMNGC